MKKLAVLIFCCLMAACGAQAATMSDSLGSLALPAGEHTYYIGPDNWVYTTDSTMPLAEEPARSLVYADPSLLVYTAVDEANQLKYPGAALLRRLRLDAPDAVPETVASIVGEAVYVAADGAVYFVRQGETAVSRHGLFTGRTEKAFTLQETPQRLTETLEGLMVCTDSSRSVYLSGMNALIQVDDDSRTVKCAAQFETELDGEGTLSVRLRGASRGDQLRLDDSVTANTLMDGAVYYLKKQGDILSLMRWTQSQGAVVLKAMGPQLLPELAAAGDAVYMIDQARKVYCYDVQTGVTETFGQLDQTVASPLLAAARHMLLIYDGASHTGAPAFVQALPTSNAWGTAVEPSPTPAVRPARPDSTPAPAQTPQALSLTRGERGEQVRRVQQALRDHGYLRGKADGIFGAATQSALCYLQYDLGMDQDGVVSPALLKRLLADEDLPDFETYVLMSKGDRGIRVVDLQQRLRALGYLNGRADGIYGADTVAAVRLFEKAEGFKQSGTATVTTQKKLFGNGAPAYQAPHSAQDPHDAEPHADTPAQQFISDDDIIYMVRWMNQNLDRSFDKRGAIARLQKRLYKLGYFHKKHTTKIYDQATYIAVKAFQEDLDLLPHSDGIARRETLAALFDLD